MTTPRRRRIAFYSHDTQGLGHIRRNIALAGAIVAAEPRTDVLILTGAPQATSLPLPPNTEVVTVPTVAKDADGRYAAGTFAMDLTSVLTLRSNLITTALMAFAPDVVVVDKVARGLDGELEQGLAALRAVRGHTTGARPRVVLGLRDILDDPLTAIREWRTAGTTQVIEDHYDEVWVYGDRSVVDVARDYDLPAAVAAKIRYTGYLAEGRSEGLVAPRDEPRRRPVPRPYVLCMVGGGQDGYDTALAFARTTYPAGHTGVIVTGPYMQPSLRRRLTAIAEEREDLVVRDFVTNSIELIAGARAVVSMGGYNTVCEVLTEDVPALVVPRVRPRREQLVRAERLSCLGLVDSMHPDDVVPERLSAWLAGVVSAPAARDRGVIALDGLRRVPTFVAELHSASAPSDVLQEMAS
ncbi:glycosyltransferase [Janibacter sp. DB-40]|uniref:glycosyltransferase family protein n=1 Tax=Janibacter sp. DB-40 TaxID=3028808 RepID=UPI00240722F3|nr:glycosyltransferase [Janibacter sp. DB-40]